MISRFLVKLNNGFVRFRRVRVRPENLLLLAPRCLQRTDCNQPLGETIDACQACGRCNITQLLALRDEFGIQCSLAAGGRQALAFVAQEEVKAVVAIACEKELVQGIAAVFPVPAIGVPNIRANGPCHDTQVDPERVRAAIQSLLKR